MRRQTDFPLKNVSEIEYIASDDFREFGQGDVPVRIGVQVLSSPMGDY
jgi:hypothetical protein